MPLITSRVPYTTISPYRTTRPKTDKIIFLSCEGCVTEEEYFDIIAKLFDGIKSKIQFVSVAENEAHTRANCRTPEQIEVISKTRPKQLVQRIETFKIKEAEKYEFEKHSEDEFWVVTDVDKNWSNDPTGSGQTYIEEWNEAISLCDQKGYKYAISNPFFEIWLLLHHDDCIDDDKKYAVTNEHPYEPTSHIRERLRDLGFPMKKQKHIEFVQFNKDSIKKAVERAKKLHIDKTDLQPHYFSSTVYMIIDDVLKIANE